jgi:hypothetical protein
MRRPPKQGAKKPENATFSYALAKGKLKEPPILVVQFNPASLQLTHTARSEGGAQKNAKQVTKPRSAHLSVELIFDTTDTLQNVCNKTRKLSALLGEKDQAPPQVNFSWGLFSFTGIVTAFKETLDFFSPQGVALRSSVSLTMTQEQYLVPAATKEDKPQAEVPTTGKSTTAVATRGGDSKAGRDIAAQNGQESMRFPSGLTLNVNLKASLGAPVSFTSAEAGPGRFPGLRSIPSTLSRATRLDASLLVPRVETQTHAVGEGAVFDLGGRMRTDGPQVDGSVRSRIQFDEE